MHMPRHLLWSDIPDSTHGETLLITYETSCTCPTLPQKLTWARVVLRIEQLYDQPTIFIFRLQLSDMHVHMVLDVEVLHLPQFKPNILEVQKIAISLAFVCRGRV